MGRCGTEGPPSPAGCPFLEVITLRGALSPCIPGQNQHRTEHILVVMSISILPISLPRQGKSDFFSETHFIQFCTYGDNGPSPTHLSMYHSVGNKAPYVHSQKLHCLCPWNPGPAPPQPLAPPRFLKGTSESLPSISTNREINRCWGEPCLGHCPLLPSS